MVIELEESGVKWWRRAVSIHYTSTTTTAPAAAPAAVDVVVSLSGKYCIVIALNVVRMAVGE